MKLFVTTRETRFTEMTQYRDAAQPRPSALGPLFHTPTPASRAPDPEHDAADTQAIAAAAATAAASEDWTTLQVRYVTRRKGAGTQVPDARVSEAQVPEAQVPEAQVPEAQVPEAQVPRR